MLNRLPRRAWPSRPRAALGATRGFHHGLLAELFSTRLVLAPAARRGVLAVACLGMAVATSAQTVTGTVAELRVHGNQVLSDAEVTALAGIAVGDPVGPETTDDVTRRLERSGRFDAVDVRARYRSLSANDQVALVIVVQEGAVPTSSNPVLRALGGLRRDILFLPLFDYSEGYGVTFGLQSTVVDLLGEGSRISVPATLGGTTRIAVEVDRPLTTDGDTRVTGGVSRSSRENPHFDVDDDRTRWWAGVERRLPLDLRVAAIGEIADVRFGGLDERVTRLQLGVELDTRRTRSFPRDAVRAEAAYEWLGLADIDDLVGRSRLELDVYKGLIGQSVLVGRAAYLGADGPLPPYERPLLGGGSTLRGWAVGAFSGDRIVHGSAEIRVPLGSALSVARVGAAVFYDTGTAYDAGQSLGGARFRHGAGAGLFVSAPLLRLRFDVAHNLVDDVRVHIGAALSF